MGSQYTLDKTITAISTPLGEGGIAVIRISGDESFSVAQKLFSKKIHRIIPNTAYVGDFLSLSGEVIDKVVMTFFKGPRSYTGEDVVEVSCHGGMLITRRVLDAILEKNVKPALPGEFTFRAFMNAKMDLAQAEAVQNLVGAKNEYALNIAEEQLQGNLSKIVLEYKEKLTSIAAILEAWVDFPEEGIEFATLDELLEELEEYYQGMQRILETFHEGKIIEKGLNICLVGRPNVGKSSLMNALLDKDRAIVTDIPGTTRDLLEDSLVMNGLHVVLTDTAGIRDEGAEVVEREGIKRSHQAMKKSDIVLFILDASTEITQQDYQLSKQMIKEKTVVIWNKEDLVNRDSKSLDFPFEVHVSAKLGSGLKELKELIDNMVWQHGAAPSKEEVVLTNVRHKNSLETASKSCLCVIQGLRDSVSPEFLTLDMREALSSLGEIIGTDITEDVLSQIFSRFCIGK
jgi:tRNA modification GTPase